MKLIGERLKAVPARTKQCTIRLNQGLLGLLLRCLRLEPVSLRLKRGMLGLILGIGRLNQGIGRLKPGSGRLQLVSYSPKSRVSSTFHEIGVLY
jgi:hypothetical protein